MDPQQLVEVLERHRSEAARSVEQVLQRRARSTVSRVQGAMADAGRRGAAQTASAVSDDSAVVGVRVWGAPAGAVREAVDRDPPVDWLYGSVADAVVEAGG